MPPIKARAIAPPGEEPNAANFLSIKNMIPRKKKPGRRPKSSLVSRGDGMTFGEDGMRKLRIPNYISSHLPSVKKFSGGGDYVDLTDDTAEIVLQLNRTNVVKRETDINVMSPRPGKSRRRRTASGGIVCPDGAKYSIQKVCEHKFATMVFDLAFAPGGALLISCDDGVYMCAADFSSITKLENVLMGGGIAFLSDGKFAVVCRNQDTVNLFMSGGTFLRSFVAGHCPLAIAVNSQDEIVVTDVGPKCIYVYGENGTRRQTLPLDNSDGGCCKLKWPQYVAVDTSDNIFVTDTHLQKVVQFDATGRHMNSVSLCTSEVNTLLKPTGICIGSDNDFFIVDDSLHTVEVFHDGDTFIQTLVHADQGAVLRPKSLRVSADGKHILIGGVFSSVWLYKFLPTVVSPLSPAVKQEPVQVKEELPDDDYNTIMLD